MSRLFQPYTIRGVELKNRIVMSPMCMYAAQEDGRVTDWHRVHYPTRAVGGAGLIILEATAVQPHGRISANDLGIWSDEHVDGLAEIVRLVHEHGAKVGIQLAHAGRKSEVAGVNHVAPSAIPFSADYDVPVALDERGINDVISSFRAAAERAKRAGFDVVEIHAAHGYLINQFLSPLTNHREDAYGGSFDNRFRLLGEVVRAVRGVWDGPLFVRVSAEEYAEGGNHLDDYVRIAARLRESGVDLIDVSSGGVVPVPIKTQPGYQVPFAEAIRTEAGIATGAVGLITAPEQAEAILEKGQADLIFLGRELLRNPYWPLAAAQVLDASIDVPVPYRRAF